MPRPRRIGDGTRQPARQHPGGVNSPLLDVLAEPRSVLHNNYVTNGSEIETLIADNQAIVDGFVPDRRSMKNDGVLIVARPRSVAR